MGVSNYAKYLKSIYPDSLWDVARIPHGSINVTLKAIKTAGQAGPQSIVLKHASPFFEDEGELQPFALQRQVRLLHIEETPMSESSGLIFKFIFAAENRSHHDESLGKRRTTGPVYSRPRLMANTDVHPP